MLKEGGRLGPPSLLRQGHDSGSEGPQRGRWAAVRASLPRDVFFTLERLTEQETLRGTAKSSGVGPPSDSIGLGTDVEGAASQPARNITTS